MLNASSRLVNSIVFFVIGDVSLSCIFLRNSSASLPRNAGVALIGFGIGITVIYCNLDFISLICST